MAPRVNLSRRRENVIRATGATAHKMKLYWSEQNHRGLLSFSAVPAGRSATPPGVLTRAEATTFVMMLPTNPFTHGKRAAAQTLIDDVSSATAAASRGLFAPKPRRVPGRELPVHEHPEGLAILFSRFPRRAIIAAVAITALVPLTAIIPVGLASASAATAPAGTTVVDSNSSQIKYSGTWRTTGSPSDNGASIKYSYATSSASLTFTGSTVAYVARTTSSSGTSDISIDGKAVATVNGYSATDKHQQNLFSTSNLSSGTHTIKVSRTGQKDSRSNGTSSIVDAFVTAAPTAATAVPPAPTPAPAASTPSVPAPAVPSTAPPAPAPIDTHRYADCPAATVTVTTARELMAAVDQAGPGTVVEMAPGTYSDQINLTANGTAANPIWICGPRSAVVNVGSIQNNHGIQISNSSNLVIAGMTVTNSLKGISVIRSTNVTVADTLIDNVGYEGIHLRAFTTDSTVVGNTITNTGQRNPFYGEGIYIGTSENNWCAQTNCKPDHTDNVRVLENHISRTGSQPIEVKEGTSNGIIRDNVIDGANMPRANEWVKVKGNDWQIYNNQGKNSTLHGFAVNGSVTGWGLRNSFFGNTVPVQAAGYGFYIHEKGSNGSSDTKVYCSNRVTLAGSGFSNQACIS